MIREKNAEIRVTEDYDPETDIQTIYVERREKAKSRFLVGMVLGAALIAGGATYLAYQHGSYQSAGAVVDENLTAAEQETREVTAETAQAIENAGDAVEDQTDRATLQ